MDLTSMYRECCALCFYNLLKATGAIVQESKGFELTSADGFECILGNDVFQSQACRVKRFFLMLAKFFHHFYFFYRRSCIADYNSTFPLKYLPIIPHF